MCESRRRVFLAGIGMGTEIGITVQVRELILTCDCLIGAGRMLDCARGLLTAEGQEEPETPMLEEYRPDQIACYIMEHPEYTRVAVLFSGDPGFYSGARKLAERLERIPGLCRAEIVPGISSVVCLAARLGISWEDAKFVSLHGRQEDFIQTVNRNRKTFLLLGTKDAGEKLLGRLKEYGMEDVIIHAAARLSYSDEHILSGTLDEICLDDLSGLTTVMIENPHPDKRACPHVRDEEFIRGKVPMTKEEVRAVSIAHLGLTRESVLYDVGAGTGSVSVEAALSGEGIRVYAVEKKEEAAALIEKNRRKFRADGIRIIRGSAPEALKDLEAPTHVFIGGSSGNLKEIIKTVQEKNPCVKIVINAISLETVREVMEAVEEGLLVHPDITQINVARSRELGTYHMMTGQNPVYIISAGGDREKCDRADGGENR